MGDAVMLSDMMGTVFQQCLCRQAQAKSSFCIAARGWLLQVVQRRVKKLLHLCKSQSTAMPAAP